MLSASVGISDPDLVVQPATISLQPVGASFTDPVFGATLRRVSDASDRGGFETQIYSQLQAFSADNQYLLLVGQDGYLVRRVSDLSAVQGLDTSEWNAPRWHPTQAHTLVHFDTNADTDVTVQFTDLDTLVTTDVFTLPAQYTHVYGNQSFDELSDDGRWLAGMVRRNDGQSVLFSVDLVDRSLGAELSLHDLYTNGHAQPDPVWGEVEPDWVGVSPLGGYLVVGWTRDGTAGASGLETFNIQTGAFVGRVNDGHQHGDLGILADGTTEYYMTFEIYGSPADRNRPAIGLRLLPGNAVVSEPSYLQSIDWGNADHISARGPNGVGLITSGVDTSNGWTNFEGELWLQYTDGRVLRLAHHRSTSSDYWVQPRASISRDGRYVVFASDWGRPTGGRGDPYIIDLESIDPPPVENRAPVLSAIGNQAVLEENLLQFTAAAADPDGNGLIYSLDAGAPDGAAIDAAAGLFTWTPTADQGPGTYSVTVRVTDDGSPSLSDWETFTITVREPPALRIANTTVRETNRGAVAARFRVTLSAVSTEVVTVRYDTADGSAAAGTDYRATGGVLTFAPGERSKMIRAAVLGDLLDEPDETFFVNLTDAVNARLGTSQGAGTIRDNDPPPRISIRNVSVREGESGEVIAAFTVALSAASGKTVTVQYGTADGTAKAGSDYLSASGVLTFAPGERSKSIEVTVLGDSLREQNEIFFVRLRDAGNGTLAGRRAVGRILNDDPIAAGALDQTVLAALAADVGKRRS